MSYKHICSKLIDKPIQPSSTVYTIVAVTENCLFKPTDKTGWLSLPVELVGEWLRGIETGQINVSMEPREMRDKIKVNSRWAAQMHSFETHLRAVCIGAVEHNLIQQAGQTDDRTC